MKTLDKALEYSKNAVLESNRIRIDREHAQVIDLIKSSFGIENFANESAHTQKAVKQLILEYWNPETGLTKKGVSAINEGAVNSLTPESTEKQVRTYLVKKFQERCKAYVNGICSSKELIALYEKVKDEVKAVKLKNIDLEMVNIVYCECLVRPLRTELKAKHIEVK